MGGAPDPARLGAHEAHYAKGVTLLRADVFDPKPETIGTFEAVYDRAALVAVAPDDQRRYVETCRALLAPGGGTFLVGFAYDQEKAPGPPWSVDEETVRRLYAGCSIELLACRSLPTSARLTDAGVKAFEESAYWIG